MSNLRYFSVKIKASKLCISPISLPCSQDTASIVTVTGTSDLGGSPNIKVAGVPVGNFHDKP